MRELTDRVAVITGAGSGIGRAMSLELAWEGCHLALSDVDRAGLAETATQVQALELDRRVTTHRVDVSDRERMRTWADEVVGVHLLVNNAGVTVIASFSEHSLEDWDWIVGVNFWGVVHGCKFFLPHLLQQQEAHIVNISSISGLMGVPMQTSYFATKFAVRGLSEALWVELKDDNIGVTSVHPAWVKTAIVSSARTTDERGKGTAVEFIDRLSVTPERCARNIVRAIKKRRMRQLVSRYAYVVETMKRWSPRGVQSLLWRGYRRWLAQSNNEA